jgi:hypothetical protein
MNGAICNSDKRVKRYKNKIEEDMKKFKIIAVLLLFAFSQVTWAQNANTAQLKQLKQDFKEKASKEARKEAKKLKKEGWVVSPGALPLERQLDRSYLTIMETDEDLNPVYIVGEGLSVGENYDAAKMQAMELARQQIAGKIGSETTALIDNLVGNKQMGVEEAATVTTLLSEGKTIISQKLGRVVPVVECYRTLKNKNKEVMVRLATKESAIREVMKGYLREEMEKKGAKMSDQLDELLSKKNQ